MRSRYDYETIRGIALYMIKNGSTVRELENKYKIPKSTIHKKLETTLQKNDFTIYLDVRKVLDKNKMERAYRGGNATRQKYLRKTYYDCNP